MNILMVITSNDKMGETDRKTGVWLEEFIAPYYLFKDAGFEITLASPKGGRPPIDPNSLTDDAETSAMRRFEADAAAKRLFNSTEPLAGIDAGRFDAVFYPGGHGPLWDLANDRHSIRLLEAFADNDRPIGAVCHGPAVLRNVRGRDGDPLVRGRAVTGFSNSEELTTGLEDVVPFSLEDEFKAQGGLYRKAGNFAPFAVADGNLVTGQNPASSQITAEKLLAIIDRKRDAA